MMTRTEIAEKEKKEDEVSKAIIAYIKESNIYSYYDCLTYAYENDLHDWINYVKDKKHRMFLSAYLKSRKAKVKGKYKDTAIDAGIRMRDAKIEYMKRNGILF